MKILRKLAFYAAWLCLIAGSRMADWAREPDADEYKVGGSD